MEAQKALEKAWKSCLPAALGESAALEWRAPAAIDALPPLVALGQSRRFKPRVAEWEALVARATPRRRQEWIAAREAELALEARCGAGLRTSVSHSSLGVLVIGAAEHPDLLGIGVDGEAASRLASPRTEARVVLPGERALFPELGFLDFWVLKEAAFKATPDNAGLTLPDWELGSLTNAASTAGAGRDGWMQCQGGRGPRSQVRLLTLGELKVAFAFVLRAVTAETLC